MSSELPRRLWLAVVFFCGEAELTLVHTSINFRTILITRDLYLERAAVEQSLDQEQSLAYIR